MTFAVALKYLALLQSPEKADLDSNLSGQLQFFKILP